MNSEEVYEFLCQANVVAWSAFIWGVSQHMKLDLNTVSNPLMCLFFGVIEGVYYTFAASVINELMVPSNLDGLISIVCITAIVFQKMTELRKLIIQENRNLFNNKETIKKI